MTAADRDEQLLRALYDQLRRVAVVVRPAADRRDRARSQDVVQETMLRAWRKPSVLDEAARVRPGLAVHRRPADRGGRVAQCPRRGTS